MGLRSVRVFSVFVVFTALTICICLTLWRLTPSIPPVKQHPSIASNFAIASSSQVPYAVDAIDVPLVNCSGCTIQGGDFRNWFTGSAEQCFTWCLENSDCIGWTWEQDSHLCWLKSMFVDPRNIFKAQENVFSGIISHRVNQTARCKSPKLLRQVTHSKLQTMSVFIVGLAHQMSKDSANVLYQQLTYLGNQFRDYRIVIYENDVALHQKGLYELTADDAKFILIRESSNFPSAGKAEKAASCGRVRLLGNYRNKLLDFVEKYQEDDLHRTLSGGFQADYLIHVDTDLITSQMLDSDKLSSIASTFRSRIEEFGASQLDVVCTSGISGTPFRHRGGIPMGALFRKRASRRRGEEQQPLTAGDSFLMETGERYFDSFALMGCDVDYYKSIWNDTFKIENVGQLAHRLPQGQDLVGVRSCFGGFAFYKMKALIQSKCRYFTERSCYCEHVPFNACLAQHGFDSIYIDQQMRFARNS